MEIEEDAEGRVIAMTMTSNPNLYVPGVGDVSIGDVVFHVCATDVDSCKVTIS